MKLLLVSIPLTVLLAVYMIGVYIPLSIIATLSVINVFIFKGKDLTEKGVAQILIYPIQYIGELIWGKS